MKVLYQVERTCRSWYSRLIPAAKYTKIITGACRLTLLTHVWLEADSDDEDGELDSEEQASKSICSEMCDYGDCSDREDKDDDHISASHQHPTLQPPSPPPSRLQPPPSPRSPPTPRRPLRHATTAVPLICTGVHTFSRTAVFRSPKQLILPELETNCELVRFELQFSEWPLNGLVRQKLTEICRDNDDDDNKVAARRDGREEHETGGAGEQNKESVPEGHSLAFFYASPSAHSSKPSMPMRLSISNPTTGSRDFDHREIDEVVKYFSKARIHKCNRRPIGRCWRAGDAGQSLSSYEVVVVGGPPGQEGHFESDHDDEDDDDDESDSEEISGNSNGVPEDIEYGQRTQRRHEHHIFPGPPSSQFPFCQLGQSDEFLQANTQPTWEESQRRMPGSRKDKRVRCPDAQEPQALLVYASEDIPQSEYDPDTHVPIIDPNKDLLTYDADLTWRDAQRASEIWVYITASFIASGYYGPKGPRLSDHAECPSNNKIPDINLEEPSLITRCIDHEAIQQVRPDHQYHQYTHQEPRHSLGLDQDPHHSTFASTLHPAIQGLRQRYEKCLQKSLECKSRFLPHTPSSSPPPSNLGPLSSSLPSADLNASPPSPPSPSSTSTSYQGHWTPIEPTGNSPLSFVTTKQTPPTTPQQTLLRIAVIQEFRERITLLQKIAAEEQLPWYSQYLQDMRVLRWVASRDTCLTRDDAITDRENAITIIRRLAKQQEQHQHFCDNHPLSAPD
ncbi:hypothetical protein BGW42_005845 [Actinomortierella wolfii]|nr:hypothetical protein BGW42_005845 [Actinomortierella wolfii]